MKKPAIVVAPRTLPEARRARPPLERARVAAAAMQAIEPLIDLLLQLGITSPEAESLFRTQFVHRTRRRLLAQHGRRGATDVRVALSSGVHRNFVHQILRRPPTIAPNRVRKGHRANRLIDAWHTDARYQDGDGKPRDLPRSGPAPSFRSLAQRYASGVAPGPLLAELARADAVLLLPDRRVRVRSRQVRTGGMSRKSVVEMGARARNLLDALLSNLSAPTDPLLCESTPQWRIERSRLPLVRAVVRRRTDAFLAALEAEIASENRRTRRDARAAPTSALALTIFETLSTTDMTQFRRRKGRSQR